MGKNDINFVFGNLNSRGGGERLTLVTMRSTLNIGIKTFDLTTLFRPDMTQLAKSFGGKLSSVMRNLRRIYIISITDYIEKSSLPTSRSLKKEYVTINTHGDKIPYYNPDMTKDNSIVYCHYPTAMHQIKRRSVEYLEKDLNIRTTKGVKTNNDDYAMNVSNTYPLKKDANKTQDVFKLLSRAYTNLINKSTVLTNSEFSRKAILSAFPSSQIQILYPPVDVDIFRSQSLESDERKDIILVISRFDPAKEIEKALSLARILKKRNTGSHMLIVGSLTHANTAYFHSLGRLIKEWGIDNYVILKPNVSLDELLKIIRRAKIYFHPKSGEHFGISIAESMAAGLAPIVPNIGGQTEFVPQKFHFKSLNEAAHLVSELFHLSCAERRQISDSITRFSTSNYIKKFQKLLSEKLR
jgi:glycosyltransferase involved in cell wall biosynthesis